MKADTVSHSGLTCLDRRDAPRYDRVLRVKCNHEDSKTPVITRDIGPSGVYLLTPGVPEPGESVTLEIKKRQTNSPKVELEARVVRKVRRAASEAKMPGSALRWVQARTSGSPEYLKSVLKSTIGLDAPVTSDACGGSFYTFDKD